MSETVFLTQKGLEEKQKEYDELVGVRRKEVADRIKEATAYGDLSENSEYDAAKNEQAELEERISVLEDMLNNYEIIDSNAAKGDVVDLGLNVHLKNITKKKEETYRIVGSAEADPFNNLISNESPIGKGLLKHKVGETVSIDIPSGKIVKYKILKISK